MADTTDSGLVGWDIGGVWNNFEEAFGEGKFDMFTDVALSGLSKRPCGQHFREAVFMERVKIYDAA